ncbi:hypothetical protein V1514DRAFT_335170 [Lipomyces japonicus]|uniref:uncharacterized protein n=1 Tax=Lipomyces japonicus TaxID=56871 RepID=UPI0034CD838D
MQTCLLRSTCRLSSTKFSASVFSKNSGISFTNRGFSVQKRPDGELSEASQQTQKQQKQQKQQQKSEDDDGLFLLDVNPDTIGVKRDYGRLSFEPPRLPPDSTFDSSITAGNSKPKNNKTRFGKNLRLLIGSGVFIWAVYAIKSTFYGDATNPADKDSAPALDVNNFATFIITHREPVGKDCVLLELSPPYDKVKKLQEKHKTKLPEQDPRDPVLAGDPGIASLWDGSRTFSVEIAQPDLQIVRRYTPLPLHYILGLLPKNEIIDGKIELERTAVLNTFADDLKQDEGKFLLLIRRYADGEVSRWLYSKPVGSRILIRGPFTEFTLPRDVQPRAILDVKRRYREHKNEQTPKMRTQMTHVPLKLPADFRPDANDLLFIAGGTGIAPVLQLLLSSNPIPGTAIIHYCVRDANDIAFKRILYFLERSGRAEVHYHVDNEGTVLKSRDLPNPWTTKMSNQATKKRKQLEAWDLDQFKNAVDLQEAREARYKGTLHRRPSYAIVSGPEGFIDFVAGKRVIGSPETNDQGKVGGLLKNKGWDETNVYKL